jgi:hypothetical protein
MPELQQPSFDGIARVGPADIRMISPGVCEMTGVAAGRYTVRMRGEEAGPEWNEVDLTTDGQELDTSSSRPTSSVKASVQVVGEAKLPPELGIALRDSKKRVVAWDQVSDQGEVNLRNLTPGKYEILAAGPNQEYSVVRIASGGGQISGHTVNVPSGSALTLALSLLGGSVNVEGVARRAGKPAPGAMIVLVPKNPEANRDLFRRDQSDLDGSFNLQSVIPGTYTAVAIEDGWDLDWAQPGVIAHYARHGQAVIVGSGAGGVVHLKNPVETQPR